jgi:hypothetical protein
VVIISAGFKEIGPEGVGRLLIWQAN